MKKFIKIFTVILLLIVAVIIIIPTVFEDKIIDLVKKTINNNLNATLDFKDADLSLWKSFPNTELSLKDIFLVNKNPFEGDTLFKARSIEIKIPLKDIFKKESDGISIIDFNINEAHFTIITDIDGNNNYDISTSKNVENKKEIDKSNSFQLDLESYKITNSSVSYQDAKSKIEFQLSDFNHSGIGNLSSAKSELKTSTTMLASFQMDSITYLKKNKIQLDALLGIDLDENIYTFLENKAVINRLPLIIDGHVKLKEKNTEVDVSFKAPSSDFKNFLALIPEVYSKNIEGVTTTGNFNVEGDINGIKDENHIPKFNISIVSDNASFKYPDLPKTLENIIIKSEISNKTGLAKDTYVLIDRLSFKIDEDVFNATAKLQDFTENMKVTANLKGVVNLDNLEKIYPAEALKGLKGKVNVNATTNFDIHSIENDQYENTKTSGSFIISNFQYTSENLSNPLKVFKAGVTFNPKTVSLNQFDANLGKSDFAVTGTMSNFLGFIFSDKNLEGKFKLKSNTFSVNDFMVSDVEKNETEIEKVTEEQIRIPAFLDCTIDAKATTVLYDNITLNNVSGQLIIKDQEAQLINMKSSVFDGSLGFNGSVSTKETIPNFQMELDIKSFNIGESFTSLDLFHALAPIANTIDGKINSTVKLTGKLNNNFTPDLNSLTGSMMAELLSSKISSHKAPLLQKLEQNLSFLDTKKLNLQDLRTTLSFKDGKVALKPFMIMYDDIEVAVSGSHGFDTSLSYDAVMNLPAKYLGKEAANLISQLSSEEQNIIKVPVTAIISGKFNNPNIKTDLKSAVTNLSKQIANNQKDKLINKGKDEVTNALNRLLDKNNPNDSTQLDSLEVIRNDKVKETAKNVLNNIFGNTKKKKDTTQ